ncbi:MAG: PaaX family transcriptional regulator C-terminal domain-containing protein [Pseudomonadota bacterium]
MIETISIKRPVTAKTLLLDLLRASAPGTWPVKALVEVAAVFGISANALRVNLARLLSRGIVEQDERGSYRLAHKDNPLRDWLQAWQQGENKVRTWDGNWLMLSIAPRTKARQLHAIEQASGQLGFREFWQRLWLRPDNLTISCEQVSEQLKAMLDEHNSAEFMISSGSTLTLPDSSKALASLWDVQTLEVRYRELISAIQISMDNLLEQAPDQIIRETFILGGEALHLLALDPLLPEEMFDASLRQTLTDLMRRYDEMGKPFWLQRFSFATLSLSPHHVQSALAAI